MFNCKQALENLSEPYAITYAHQRTFDSTFNLILIMLFHLSMMLKVSGRNIILWWWL